MKSIFLISCASVFMLQAQQQDTIIRQKHAIKLNPLSAVFGTLNLNYEYALSPKTTLGMIGSYTFNLPFLEDESKITLQGQTTTYTTTHYLSGLSIMPEYRYYFNKYAFKGFYTGGYLKYNHQNTSLLQSQGTPVTTQVYKINQFGIGGLIGYQALLGKKDRIPLDFTLGIAYNSVNLKKVGTYIDPFGMGEELEDDIINYIIAPHPIAVRFAIRLGFAWH